LGEASEIWGPLLFLLEVIMYEDYENLDYLAHHGILGMKWGKQNGPPYPLSDAKHDRVVQRAEKKRIRREKRAADKKAKILSDPKKIVKYQSKLTKREIDSALKKLDSVDKVRERITESTLKKHIKKVRLSNKKKRWAATPEKLQANAHKFTPEELDEAIKYLQNTEKIFNARLERASRPSKVIGTIGAGIGNVANTIGNVNKVRDNTAKLFGGFTTDEKHKQWLKENTSDEMFKILNEKKKGKKEDD